MMMLNRKAAAQYGEVMVETGVSGADGTQLIQLLLDGFIESLDIAEGHIKRKAISEKSYHLTRAGRIILGLQDALDFKQGGDIARTLSELYQYVTRRLLHINMRNDLVALGEVRGLMQQVREAWALVPSLVTPARRAM